MFKYAPICMKDCLANLFDEDYKNAIKSNTIPDPVWIANLKGHFNPGRLRAFILEAEDLIGAENTKKLLNNDLFIVPKNEYLQLNSYACLLEKLINTFFSQFASIRSGRLAEKHSQENQTQAHRSPDNTHHQQPDQE